MTTLALPDSVRLVEVGLRDGLQAVPEPLRTQDKVELVELLIDAGVTEIEAVSFAHPKVLPQLADARGHVVGPVDRRTGHEDVGPGLDASPDRVLRDTSVDLDPDLAPVPTHRLPDMKDCPPNPGSTVMTSTMSTSGNRSA